MKTTKPTIKQLSQRIVEAEEEAATFDFLRTYPDEAEARGLVAPTMAQCRAKHRKVTLLYEEFEQRTGKRFEGRTNVWAPAETN